MKIGEIDLDKEVLIIAEIGNNHEGNFEVAGRMISVAAQAGVHAVKFQTITPEKLISKDQGARIQQLKKFQFSKTQFEKLKLIADHEKILFLSTPFDLESARFLNDLVPAFKIASGDNTFYPLLQEVAYTGKPIILSTGMTTILEVQRSVDVIKAVWKEKGTENGTIALLHCNVSYPTPPEDVNLLSIAGLKETGYTVGYSDHTLGIDAAIASVAAGARIIEKHFTLDKNLSSFRDHQLSANPDELKMLVEKTRLINKMLGTKNKQITESEKNNTLSLRRSIAARRDLPKDHLLTMEDLQWVRPGTGMAPGEESKVIGKRLQQALQAGEIIRAEYITKL